MMMTMTVVVGVGMLVIVVLVVVLMTMVVGKNDMSGGIDCSGVAPMMTTITVMMLAVFKISEDVVVIIGKRVCSGKRERWGL